MALMSIFSDLLVEEERVLVEGSALVLYPVVLALKHLAQPFDGRGVGAEVL